MTVSNTDRVSIALVLRNYTLRRPTVRSGQPRKEDVEIGQAVAAAGGEPAMPSVEDQEENDRKEDRDPQDSDSKDDSRDSDTKADTKEEEIVVKA